MLRAAGANPDQDAASSSAETHDRFRDVMVPFAESADAEITAVQALATDANESMKATTEFFGEPFKVDNAGRIFKLVADFLVTFDKVTKDMDAAAAAEVRKIKHEEAAALRKSRSAANTPRDGGDDGSGGGGDASGPGGLRSSKQRGGGHFLDPKS